MQPIMATNLDTSERGAEDGLATTEWIGSSRVVFGGTSRDSATHHHAVSFATAHDFVFLGAGNRISEGTASFTDLRTWGGAWRNETARP